jgi:hypothetical protein
MGILLLLMFLPEGLGGLVYRVRDAFLRRVARRRDILVPSLLADVRVDDDPPPADGVDVPDLAEVDARVPEPVA